MYKFNIPGNYVMIDRLGFFERRGVLLSSAQMQTQAVSHYRQQLMLQIYVVIFGLDVLGNPYGLIKDITEGLGELFYEPLLVSQSVTLPTEHLNFCCKVHIMY